MGDTTLELGEGGRVEVGTRFPASYGVTNHPRLQEQWTCSTETGKVLGKLEWLVGMVGRGGEGIDSSKVSPTKLRSQGFPGLGVGLGPGF